MGMTDSQFKGFIRFVLGDLQNIYDKMTEEAPKAELAEVIDKLQQTLED